MLSVAYKPFMLSVIMLNVIMLSVLTLFFPPVPTAAGFKPANFGSLVDCSTNCAIYKGLEKL